MSRSTKKQKVRALVVSAFVAEPWGKNRPIRGVNYCAF